MGKPREMSFDGLKSKAKWSYETVEKFSQWGLMALYVVHGCTYMNQSQLVGQFCAKKYWQSGQNIHEWQQLQGFCSLCRQEYIENKVFPFQCNAFIANVWCFC